MFALFGIFLTNITYSGPQTQPVYVDVTNQKDGILITDCTFRNIGNAGSKTAIEIVGNFAFSVNITTNFFDSCTGTKAGAISAEGNYNLKIYKNAAYRCRGGNWKTGAVSFINVQAPIINYLSAYQCQGGAKNIHIAGAPIISFMNLTNSNADKGNEGYSYGNLFVGYAKKSFLINFCNFQENYSPCATIFIKDSKNARIGNTNIYNNEIYDYGIVISSGSGNFVSLMSCVLQKNRGHAPLLETWYGGSIMIVNSVIDVLTTKGSVQSLSNTMSFNMPTIDIAFYATAKVQAKNTYRETTEPRRTKEKVAAAVEAKAQKGVDESDVLKNMLYVSIVILAVFVVYIVFISIWSARHNAQHSHHHHSEEDNSEESPSEAP